MEDLKNRIKDLEKQLEETEISAAKDYKDMRSFQMKFMNADQERLNAVRQVGRYRTKIQTAVEALRNSANTLEKFLNETE